MPNPEAIKLPIPDVIVEVLINCNEDGFEGVELASEVDVGVKITLGELDVPETNILDEELDVVEVLFPMKQWTQGENEAEKNGR
ncbi:MAG: hypothetical protein M1820_006344 [Bogoriella megaspora]|nr:MAG: hypothetical protein M1820_006344 [Bogoriella megaspora]